MKLKTRVMGVLNVTPDSFSDGGRFYSTQKAVARAHEMAAQGATIIDVGGESSRPGARAVTEGEERKRILPVVRQLAKELSIPVSVDTCKPVIARECLALGAKIVNDVTGLRNPEMREVIAAHKAGVVIMHMKGTPESMQETPVYAGDVVGEIAEFLQAQAQAAERAGIKNIIVDPGIGFGKTLEHNLQILARLDEIVAVGYPVLVGTSRKSFIGALAGAPVGERLPGTLASTLYAVLKGASIVRVHDVQECVQGLSVAEAIRDSI